MTNVMMTYAKMTLSLAAVKVTTIKTTQSGLYYSLSMSILFQDNINLLD